MISMIIFQYNLLYFFTFRLKSQMRLISLESLVEAMAKVLIISSRSNGNKLPQSRTENNCTDL